MNGRNHKIIQVILFVIGTLLIIPPAYADTTPFRIELRSPNAGKSYLGLPVILYLHVENISGAEQRFNYYDGKWYINGKPFNVSG